MQSRRTARGALETFARPRLGASPRQGYIQAKTDKCQPRSVVQQSGALQPPRLGPKQARRTENRHDVDQRVEHDADGPHDDKLNYDRCSADQELREEGKKEQSCLDIQRLDQNAFQQGAAGAG